LWWPGSGPAREAKALLHTPREQLLKKGGEKGDREKRVKEREGGKDRGRGKEREGKGEGK